MPLFYAVATRYSSSIDTHYVLNVLTLLPGTLEHEFKVQSLCLATLDYPRFIHTHCWHIVHVVEETLSPLLWVWLHETINDQTYEFTMGLSGTWPEFILSWV